MTGVLPGFCHVGKVDTVFMMSLFNVYDYEHRNQPGVPVCWPVCTSNAVVADARDALVRHFLSTDCEWLWVLDPDIVLKPDTLRKLYLVADPKRAPIISAPYWGEFGTDDKPVRCVVWLADAEGGMRPFVRLPEDENTLMELAACGMGCTLIHRTVFEALQKAHGSDPWPWFAHDILENKNGRQRAAEDVTFCLRARKAGFPVFGHCGAQVGHHKMGLVPEHSGELVAA